MIDAMRAGASGGMPRVTAAGEVPAVERVRVALVYDRESGQVVHRNVVITLHGAASVSDERLLAQALDSATDAAEGLQAAVAGECCPRDRMRAVLSTDPRHAELECHVDPSSGRILEPPASA